MAPSDGCNDFDVDKLRANDEAAWNHIETKVLPKIIRALQRKFGPGRLWHDLEGFARSAERTGYRRLQERADPRLEKLESFDDFENWLVIVACNKFGMELRKAKVEEKHRPTLLRAALLGEHEAALGLDQLEDIAAEEVVNRLSANLHDEKDKAVFHGKLTGKKEVVIADEVGKSTRWVRYAWARIQARLKREADENVP